MRQHISGLALMAAAMVAICASTTTGAAQKGGGSGGTTGGGSVPGQKIYSYEDSGTARTTFSMNTDGTAKTALFSQARPVHSPTSSYELHNGKRWIVQSTQPGYYEHLFDTEVRFFSETGQSRVFAVDFGTVDPVSFGGVIWSPGDQELSFVGRRIEGAVWSENYANLLAGTVTEVGIFAVQVIYDAAGEPAGISTPYLKIATPRNDDSGDQYGDTSVVYDFDWSADGSAIVCTGNLSGTLYGPGGALFVMDALGLRVLRSTGSSSPAWAPGTLNRIAYVESMTGGNSQLCTIGIDGSGRQVVVTPKITGGTTRGMGNPQWSPNAASIAYQFSDPLKPGIYRVAASGSGNTRISSSGTPIAWK